jgi:hypothetical protein
LVTVESHRQKPIRTQAKELVASNLISGILIGNQTASDKELKEVASIDLKAIELDLEISENLSKLENDLLFEMKHFSRGDLNEFYVRSTMGKVIYGSREDLKPNNVKDVFQKGDVVILNKNDINYQKELVIIKNDNFTGFDNHQGNLVGRIKNYDLDLFDLIQP